MTNNHLYRAISKIPIIGHIFQMRTNAFYGIPSPMMEELIKTKEFEKVLALQRDQPDKILDPKTVRQLLKRKVEGDVEL